MRWCVCLLGAVCAATLLSTIPARAQPCRLCDPTTAEDETSAPAQPVALQVQANLNFDRLVLLDANGGTVRLDTDGSRATSGGVAAPTGRAMVGSVLIHGEPNRAIRIDLPERIELWGAGSGRITIERLETDLATSPRLDTTGRLTFRFGGELRISGDAEGDFRGDIPITVEYL